MTSSRRHRVSSKGLTRCPQCARHIFLADNWRATDCEFCGARLIASPATTSQFLLERIRNGRSGLVAAGLLSISLSGAGCVDDRQPDPSDQGMTMQGVDQMVGQMPPMQDARPEDDAAFDAAPEPMPQPEYGAPPETDAGIGEDAQIDAAPEPMPQPEYGAPPEPDAGSEDDAELDAAPEPLPQPEYGGPPDGDE